MRRLLRLGLVTIFAVIFAVAAVSVAAWTNNGAAGSGLRQRLLVVSAIPRSPRYQIGHVYNGHGRLLRTLKGASLTWSPNGEMVAIAREDGVWVKRANGSDRRQLVSCPNACTWPSFGGPAWTPDGRRLAVGGIDSPMTGLELVDVATGLATVIANKPHPYDTYFPIAFSPNGRLLAYGFEGGEIGTASCCISELVVSRTDGTRARVLYRFHEPIHDGPTFSTWSPDSTRIAFTDDGWGDPRLAIVGVRTGRMHALNPHGSGDQYPAWSPNGKRLALARGDSGAITLATNGSGFRSLHVTTAYAPLLWLRDGDLLLSLGHKIELLPGGRGSPQPHIKLPGHEQLLSVQEGK